MEPVDKKRKDVWIAFSDLFLDTDQTIYYKNIIQVCAGSNFSIKELQEILFYEVAPVCSANLKSVAGEWIGFDQNWLISNIFKHTNKKEWKLKLYKYFGFKGYIKDHWKKLEIKIIDKRNGN